MFIFYSNLQLSSRDDTEKIGENFNPKRRINSRGNIQEIYDEIRNYKLGEALKKDIYSPSLNLILNQTLKMNDKNYFHEIINNNEIREDLNINKHKENIVENFEMEYDFDGENEYVKDFIAGTKLNSFSEFSQACYNQNLDIQKFVKISENLFIFSAYWDDRANDFDNKNGSIFVRMMTLKQARPHEVYCNFFNDKNVFLGKSMVTRFYEMCENHNLPFGGYILSCKVPSKMKLAPCSLFLSTEEEETDYMKMKQVSLMEVSYKNRITNKPYANKLRKFTICVPPLFNSVDPFKLIEFIEMSFVLGFQHIYFYKYDVSKEIEQILEYYSSQRKSITLINWPFPPNLDKKTWYHGQLISIQDCLYRNMAQTEYLAFQDIDELFVPRRYSNWRYQINNLEKHENLKTNKPSDEGKNFFIKNTNNNNELKYLPTKKNNLNPRNITGLAKENNLKTKKNFHSVNIKIYQNQTNNNNKNEKTKLEMLIYDTDKRNGKQEKVCGYQFISAFFEDSKNSLEFVKHLRPNSINFFNSLVKTAGVKCLQHTSRTTMFDTTRTKCIVKPYLIFEKGIHHISKPIWAHLKTVRVTPDDGLLHHYKSCSLGYRFFSCIKRQQDETILKYADTLMSRLQVTYLNLKKFGL